MKCIVLAGGKGNSLWPLSRENYPKQFMDIKNNRSLFQESIARNIPFCDEFIISTHEAYHFYCGESDERFSGVEISVLSGRRTKKDSAGHCYNLYVF